MVSVRDLLPPPKYSRINEGPEVPLTTISPPESLASRRKEFNLTRPSSSEREEQLQRTQAALEALIAAKNGEVDDGPRKQAIEYTTPGGDSRTINIVEQQNDPLEPPRHRYRKAHQVTAVTPETAAPILREDPKLTAEEKQQWKVPASISNWKNARGYIIDLEKRAAADKNAVPTASTKHDSLAAALSTAGNEFRAEQEAKRQAKEQAASDFEKQQRLKLRLLSQKSKASMGQKRSREGGKDDEIDHVHDNEKAQSKEPETDASLFDSRLYHKSKRRHDVYDKPLFAAQGGQAFRPSNKRADNDLNDLRPVEFEDA